MIARTEAALRRARQFLLRDLWRPDLAAGSSAGWLRSALQLAVAIGEGFVNDRLLLRASALTYFTMLSLVPLLAVGLSMVEAFGVSGELIELMVARFAAGNPRAVEHIIGLVENVNFAGLGTLGAATLLVTTVLAIGSVEKAFNDIWRVGRPRGLTRRFPDYLAVVVVAPLLIGVAVSLGTSLRSQIFLRWIFEIPLLAALYDSGLRHLPTLLLVAGFAFLYWFLPNTRVRVVSALLGALVAGGLFVLAQAVFVGFNVGAARYNAVFGGLAFLPLLLIWIYISWAVVLLGAEVAFAHQNLAVYRREVATQPPGPAARESMGLAVAVELARRFRDGEPAWQAEAMADALRVPLRTVRELLGRLEEAGIAAQLAGERGEGAWQLGRAAERVSVARLLEALRGPREMELGGEALASEVKRLFGELDRRERESTEHQTLADLAERLPGAR